MIARLGLLFSLLVGCASDWKVVDGDGDGLSPADGDCWDAVEGPPGSGLSGAEIYPGAPDAPYDGFDADCAGNDDYDLDGDGYVTEDGFAGLETYAVAGTGAATLSGDCWDNPDLTPEGFTALNGFSQPTAADVNPSASDTWYDAVDANCAADDDFDADGDGYTSSYYADADGALGEDCFDDVADDFYSGDFEPGDIYPGATEFCGDEVDNDCDTQVDGDDLDAKAVYWYPDVDTDTFGDIDAEEWKGTAEDAPEGYAIRVCDDPTTKDAAFVIDNTDCDDAEETTYPAAPEYCDTVDNDCNGNLDDDYAEDAPTFYADTDSDGYGDPKSTTVTCDQPSGYSVDPTDCDDSEALICPGCAEQESLSDCMADLDDDGYGDASPGAGVTIGTDCDDDDATSNPGEAEVVGNEVDNDCSGGETCYTDADDDGYRPNASSETESTDDDCTDSGEATASEPTDDCDDNDATSNPGEIEVVGNEVDNDCSGGETCYLDDDNDGYRPDPTSTQASADDDCDDNNEATSSEPVGDCDDNDNSINPGATELCDGDDNDCDGITDEDDAADADTWYVDADGDGDGDFNTSDVECYQPSGYVSNSDDCDDSEPDAYSGAPIICNDGIADNDCDTVDDAECLFEDMDLSSSDVILTGPSGMQMGYVLSAGDITGYGSVDLLIGGFVGDGAYIVEGVISSDLTLGASGTHAITGTAGEQTGYASSVVGDVDNDGNTDILIGAYTSDETTVNGGVAYLMYGPVTNDRDLTDSADYDVLIDGTINQGRFGYAAIGVGDQDSDGYDDLLVSAYKADGNANNSGVVYLLYGGISGSTASDVDGIILDGEAGSDQAGWSLSAGDVNGDGGQDILIGANLADATGTDMGQAYFFASPISSTDLISADYVLTGGSDSDMAGESVAFVDVNDDGYDDLVVGAIGVGSSSEDGAVYIYFSSGSAFSGSADLSAATADVLISAVSSSGANLGASVASGGDVNGDGAEDLLLGADKSTGSNGSAYLFYGGVASGSYAITSADVTFSGYGTSRAGSALLGTDLDVDGYSDVIIGGYRGASDAGEIFVNFGVTE